VLNGFMGHARATASPRTYNNHRNFEGMRDGGTHRAAQHAREPAAAAAADHHELSVLGFLNEPVGWLVAYEPPLHGHIGILFLPSGQAFG
jgi:hypothetical protein